MQRLAKLVIDFRIQGNDMHSLVGIAIKTAMFGLALFVLVACESPEERVARESQHNGKSVAQMNAIFGPPVQKSATHAVWAQHNSFVVRHPIYDYYGGVSVIVGNWGNLPGFGKAPIPCQQGRPFCNE